MIGDPCIARYESDQVRCAECRLVWDRNDPDPPECGRKVASPPLVPEPDPFRYVINIGDRRRRAVYEPFVSALAPRRD